MIRMAVRLWSKYRAVALAFVSGMLLSSLVSRAPSSQYLWLYKQADEMPEGPQGLEEMQANELGEARSFHDLHKHHDNDVVARKLYEKVRILCWVMTGEANHRKKADHVMATWGRRCNTLLFISDANDTRLPVVLFDDIDKGRAHLTAKTIHAFQYSYEHHMEEADWFLKVDDDSYVILENLRYFLTSQSTLDPVFFGHHFKTILKQGYFSGGGGYVLSREALRRFGERNESVKCKEDGGAEDAEFGRCMQNVGVRTGDSRDVLGRSRFHCFDPGTFISGGYPAWYLKYDKYGAQKGIHSVSDYPITFHYINPKQMYVMEYFVYHLRAYGIQMVDQHLNGPAPELLITEVSELGFNVNNRKNVTDTQLNTANDKNNTKR